ncbi:MAG TPA: LuxR C-terminal-related transcriptional regulator [Burkholderiales bacterium]
MLARAAAAAALAEATRAADERPANARLSTREYQVFLALAAGRTLTEIAQSLALSLSTVSTYRARILEKLRAHNDVEIALYAVRHRLLGGAAPL